MRIQCHVEPGVTCPLVSAALLASTWPSTLVLPPASSKVNHQARQVKHLQVYWADGVADGN